MLIGTIRELVTSCYIFSFSYHFSYSAYEIEEMVNEFVKNVTNGDAEFSRIGHSVQGKDFRENVLRGLRDNNEAEVSVCVKYKKSFLKKASFSGPWELYLLAARTIEVQSRTFAPFFIHKGSNCLRRD